MASTINFENIPQELKERRQWLVWLGVKKANGKLDKKPYNANTERLADPTNPNDWVTFEEAIHTFLHSQVRSYAGIGYAFDIEDPYTGIDRDDCVDEHGNIDPEAQETIDEANSYTEVSPSGKGIKLFVRGDLPKNIKTKSIELYDCKRFFAVTGNHVPGTPQSINNAQPLLDRLVEELAPKDEPPPIPPQPRPGASSDAYLRAWAEDIATRAARMVAYAQDGEKHNVRLKAARLWAGLIPHNLATADQIEAALFHARPPKSNKAKELKAIQDGIKNGSAEPLDLPPEPPMPIFDEDGAVCCPDGHGRLVASKNGNGWRCPSLCGFWWKGEGYALPQPMNGKVEIPDTSTPTHKLLHASELQHLPPSKWLIDSVLPTNKLVELFGIPGHGKSFTALDISLSVAQFANVIYVAAEDAEDYEERIDAWCKHHKAGRGGLYFWPEAINLFNQASIDAFLAEAMPISPVLITFDPLVNCMVGGDENSTKDMTITTDRLNYIRRQTQATIFICHHAGWNDAHERGSSVLRGVCRVVMKQTNIDGLLTLTCEKINGRKEFEPRYFQLIPSGDSVVPVPTAKISRRDAPMSQKQIDILDALYLSTFADGATFTQLVEHLNFAKATMNRNLSKLLDRGYITQDGKGHMKRYRMTDSGIDVLLAAQSEAAHESSDQTTQAGASAELSLNWHIQTDVFSRTEVPLNKTVESESSAEFRKSSAKVPHQSSEFRSAAPLKGAEQRNGTKQQNSNGNGSTDKIEAVLLQLYTDQDFAGMMQYCQKHDLDFIDVLDRFEAAAEGGVRHV